MTYYDWDDDLYPIHHIEPWARRYVIGWMKSRNIRPHVVPDLCNAAAIAYRRAVMQTPSKGYVCTSMANAMIDALDRVQMGAKTSRSARGNPNFTYAEASETGDVDWTEYPTARRAERLSADEYRNLKAAARGFQRSRVSPEEQQNRYLDRMHFREAMRDLSLIDPFAGRVAFECIVWDKTAAATASKLQARKGRVLEALHYAEQFIADRLKMEEPL